MTAHAKPEEPVEGHDEAEKDPRSQLTADVIAPQHDEPPQGQDVKPASHKEPKQGQDVKPAGAGVEAGEKDSDDEDKEDPKE